VYLEDGSSASDIWLVENYPSVKTTGAEQGGIQYIRSVGGGDNDNTGIGIKTVHFHQNLVQGLLPLIMATAQPGTTVATDGVNLINEDNTGGIPLSLVKEVAHP
jgi:hypothetical protein